MPKLVVLFFGAESPASTLAEAAAEGAAGVRFSEVDVRAGASHQPSATRRHRVLESPKELLDYAGVVLSAPAAGEIPAELDAFLGELERVESHEAFAHTVFAVVGGENTVLMGRVARLGGIIVTEPPKIEDPETRARETGKRVAKVVGWIRHALSHEHHH
ncbi:MAG TPA: hypothetical protein VIP11_22460 [Gemmatimonadaceae bacterium]